MNRNLVYFGVFLVLLGIGFDFYPISFLGLILLIPALLSPSRPPMTRVPEAPKQEPKRIIPAAQPQPPASGAEPKSYFTPPPPTQTQTYAPALFPMPMFPSLSQMGTVARPVEPVPQKQGERDELIEVGAMLALMKLALG